MLSNIFKKQNDIISYNSYNVYEITLSKYKVINYGFSHIQNYIITYGNHHRSTINILQLTEGPIKSSNKMFYTFRRFSQTKYIFKDIREKKQHRLKYLLIKTIQINSLQPRHFVEQLILHTKVHNSCDLPHIKS